MFSTIISTIEKVFQFKREFVFPVVLLVARLQVAWVFFNSGYLKFGYVINDQLDTLYFLFEDYNVPFLPVKVAAWMGMIGELVFSTLLGLGIFARIGGLGLIAMSAVIYSVDQSPQAVYWVLISAIVVAYGAGKISVDAFVWPKISGRGRNRM